MREPSRPEAFLATPRGTLALLGGSLALAAVVAGATTTQRAFFESRVRESYEVVPAVIDELGESLDSPAQMAQVPSADLPELRRLYAGWMTGGDHWPAAAPQVLMAAAPAAFLRFALQTLVAGSSEQQARAIRFLGRSCHAEARPLLELAQRRAEARHDDELARAARQALMKFSAPARGGREGLKGKEGGGQ